MKKLEELRVMSYGDLESELLTTRKKQFGLSMARANNDDKVKPHMFGLLRRYIAKIKTIMTEKAGK
jgi:large subunit ribosomal protein L29